MSDKSLLLKTSIQTALSGSKIVISKPTFWIDNANVTDTVNVQVDK